MKKSTMAVAALSALCSGASFATDISTGAEFASALAADPNGSYTLTADINLTGSGYETLAEFNGSIDGAGYTISGIGAQPLFTDFYGSIQDVTIAGGTVITVDGTSAIALNAYGARFEDVTVSGYTLRHKDPSKSSGNGADNCFGMTTDGEAAVTTGTFTVTNYHSSDADLADLNAVAAENDAYDFNGRKRIHGGLARRKRTACHKAHVPPVGLEVDGYYYTRQTPGSDCGGFR